MLSSRILISFPSLPSSVGDYEVAATSGPKFDLFRLFQISLALNVVHSVPYWLLRPETGEHKPDDSRSGPKTDSLDQVQVL